MAENIKERLLEIIETCKAKYSSPESIAALQKTFQSHNITIEDWNSLIEYVKTAIDTGNDLIEIIGLVGEYVIQTVEDKMEEVDDTLALKADKIGELPHFTVLDNDDVSTFIENNNLNGKPIVLKHSINSYIGQFRVLMASSTVAYIGFHFKALDGTFVYSGAFDLEDISTPSHKFSDLFSNTYLNSLALIKGPLPGYEVNGTDNIVDFITTNDVNNKPLIIYIDSTPYIGIFHYYASGVNALSFELEIFDNLDEGTTRYAATAIVDADTKKFSDILVSANSKAYELKNNKVTTLSSSSSNTQYPSAKLVYDQLQTKENVSNKVTEITTSSTNTQYPSARAVWNSLQNLREVAEGKTKSYVINPNPDVSLENNGPLIYVDTNFEEHQFSSFEEFETWMQDRTILNSTFASSNRKILIDGNINDVLQFDTYRYVAGRLVLTHIFIPLESFVPSITTNIHLGDVFYVDDFGGSVPDRWVSSIYRSNSGMGQAIVIELSVLDAKTDLTSYRTAAQEDALLAQKQETLVSGTNIKTINGQSVLGSGNLQLFELATDEDIDNIMEDTPNE